MPKARKISSVVITATVLLGLGLIQFGCGTPKDVKNTQPRTLLFEVVQNKSPVDYPFGRTLLIRVFKNGDVEFDRYPASLPKGGKFTSELWASELTPNELGFFNINVAQLAARPNTPKYDLYTTGDLFVDSHTSLTIKYESNGEIYETIVEDRQSSIDLRKLSSPHFRELLERSYEISNRMKKESR